MFTDRCFIFVENSFKKNLRKIWGALVGNSLVRALKLTSIQG